MNQPARHGQQGGPGLKWLFFGFSGRIARQSFILAQIVMLLALAAVTLQIVKAGQDQQLLAFWGFVFMATALVLAWCVVALAVKRLHDIGMPGALALLLFVPAINWAWILFLMVMPGNREANAYGPPPFGPPSAGPREG